VLNVLFMVEEAALDPVLEQHLMIKGVRVFFIGVLLWYDMVKMPGL